MPRSLSEHNSLRATHFNDNDHNPRSDKKQQRQNLKCRWKYCNPSNNDTILWQICKKKKEKMNVYYTKNRLTKQKKGRGKDDIQAKSRSALVVPSRFELETREKFAVFLPSMTIRDNLEKTRMMKYPPKEPPPPEPYKNVMYDRRVVKGPNYGVNSLLVEYELPNKFNEVRRRLTLRKNLSCQKNLRNILGTPPPVHGRRHEVMQTDKYLEELVLHPPEFDAETQTDLFLEKPAQPPYTPAKIGIDVGTEIGEGELFHFDAEAQPIIEVMVDGTIEMTVLEMAHEREIETIRRRQDELLAQREAELAELRRLEDEEIRLRAEKERRIRQDAIAKSMDDEIQKEVIAAKILQGHIASILPEILDNLEPATDAAKRQKLIDSLCPWLATGVAEEVGQIVDCREVLKNLIKEIIKQKAEIYAGYREEEGKIKVYHEGAHEECEMELCKEESETDPGCLSGT